MSVYTLCVFVLIVWNMFSKNNCYRFFFCQCFSSSHGKAWPDTYRADRTDRYSCFIISRLAVRVRWAAWLYRSSLRREFAIELLVYRLAARRMLFNTASQISGVGPTDECTATVPSATPLWPVPIGFGWLCPNQCMFRNCHKPLRCLCHRQL